MTEFQRKKFVFERIAGKINLHPFELTIGMALVFWLIMYIFYQVANLPFKLIYIKNELVWFTYWGIMALWLKYFADSFVETILTLNLAKEKKQELIEGYPPYNRLRYLLISLCIAYLLVSTSIHPFWNMPGLHATLIFGLVVVVLGLLAGEFAFECVYIGAVFPYTIRKKIKIDILNSDRCGGLSPIGRLYLKYSLLLAYSFLLNRSNVGHINYINRRYIPLM